jgi:hypothetical protein
VQSDDSALAAWLHDIFHIQEGDLVDAEYWYDKANRHFRSFRTLDEDIAILDLAHDVGIPLSVVSLFKI